MSEQPERMTIEEVMRLAREGRLEGTWEGAEDGVLVRVSNEEISVQRVAPIPVTEHTTECAVWGGLACDCEGEPPERDDKWADGPYGGD